MLRRGSCFAAVPLALAAVLAAVLAAAPAAAASVCESAGDSIARISCYRAELDKADAELNRIWPLVNAEIDGLRLDRARLARWRRALLVSQRAWIAFKEAECALQPLEFVTPGAYQTEVELHCQWLLTHDRVMRLKQVYEIE